MKSATTTWSTNSVLRCPKCNHSFCDACKVSDEPYFDLYGYGEPNPPKRDDHPDQASQRNRLVQDQFEVPLDSSEANDYVACCKCGHVDSKAVWMLKPQFDDPTWPREARIITELDAGARVDPNQKRLRERAALLDEIADEANQGEK